jgi:hypothetical protein
MDFVKLENREEILDYLFLNFKIISQLKEGQKLRIRELNGLEILDIDTRLIYKYLRGINGDNRDNTIILLKNLVDLSYTITDEILKDEFEADCIIESNGNNHKVKENLEHSQHSEHFGHKKSPFDTKDDNSQLFKKLVTEFENSLVGLNNLKTTYQDDISITSLIEIIIGKLTLRINKINSLLKITKK